MMDNVVHLGNTSTVGYTCFSAINVSPEDAAVLGELGATSVCGYKQFYVAMENWPAVYMHLTMLGHKVPFISPYAVNHTGKLQEWLRAGFHEEVREAYLFFRERCNAVIHTYFQCTHSCTALY